MKIELKIDGYFDMTIFQGSRELDKETSLSVMDNLQQGEYVIGLDSKTISDINDLETPLYTFEINPTVNVSYEFDQY